MSSTSRASGSVKPSPGYYASSRRTWGETLGKRLSAHPKVHVIDSGLAGWLLGLSAAKINSRNPAALTEFGHLVETFAVGEILKQASWAEEVTTASHFRTEAGDEVDLVLETWDGRVAGF
jgi:uncharacterized protein